MNRQKDIIAAVLFLSLMTTIGCGGSGNDTNVIADPTIISDDIRPSENGKADATPTAIDDEVIAPTATTTPEPVETEVEAPQAPETPPAVPAALTLSLAGSKTLHEKKEGLIQIHYSRSGGGDVQQFYVYGPFSGDSDCDGGLVIDPSGYDLNKGSANYFKYEHLLTGEICKDLEGNCMDYDGLEAPGTFCRIELTGESGVFFTRIHQETAKYVLVGQDGDGTFTKAAISFKRPTPKPVPTSRNHKDTVAYAPWSATPAPASGTCGDGSVDANGVDAIGNTDDDEQCDDGNDVSGDGCYRCKIDKGWTCQVPAFATASVCSQFNYECGDGYLNTPVYAGEQCDDKNTDAGDGCYNCEIEAGWECSYSIFTFTNTCWRI